MAQKSPTPTPPGTTAEEVFYQALSFEHSAQILNYSMYMAGFRSGGPTKSLLEVPPALIPLTVCLTFSVELYLKCLIRLETNTASPHGHVLESLFALVSPARQGRIKHYYDAQTGPQRAAHVPGCPHEFHAALKVTSDYFVTGRYAYERKMTPGGNYALFLAPAVRHTIIEVRPKWAKHLMGLSIQPTSPSR